MIDTEDLKQCTCLILPSEGSGTGIFVSEDLIITSLHVVKKDLEGMFMVRDVTDREIAVVVKDHCEVTDLAILQTQESWSGKVATLCNYQVVVDEEWALHGHPNGITGLDVGLKLSGKIADIITKVASDIQQDVQLMPDNFSATTRYEGFSGSGVINNKGHVMCIVRYKETNGIGAVSIRKAEDFLRRNNVNIREDELGDFGPYADTAFTSWEDPLRTICRTQAKKVGQAVSPQVIADSLKGGLFFPKRPSTLKELISYLRRDADLSKSLWVGWLEFLSYVDMLKGTYTDINAIHITFPALDVAKMVSNTESSVTIDFKVKLQFFFTEETQYFTIAKAYLIEKGMEGSLNNNSCHIFHSRHPKFGFSPLSVAEKRALVQNIANPEDAGLKIVGKIEFGIMSFNELSIKVAGSTSLKQATENLEKLFKDAIN